MAEAGEPIAMAAGSVLREARISLGTAPGGTRCTTQRQPSVWIPHGSSTISKRTGKLDYDVRLANTCIILWWRVEAQSCHDHTASLRRSLQAAPARRGVTRGHGLDDI